MSLLMRCAREAARIVVGVFRGWFNTVGEAKGCLRKAAILGGRIVAIACLCFGAMVALTATVQAIGLIPTATIPRLTTTATPLSLTATGSPIQAAPAATSTVSHNRARTISCASGNRSALWPAVSTVTFVATGTDTEPTQASASTADGTTTAAFAPTATPAAPIGARLFIVSLNKEDKYADIANQGDQPQVLTGWVLRSERGSQDCALSGVIEPGATLRVWAMPGAGGFS